MKGQFRKNVPVTGRHLLDWVFVTSSEEWEYSQTPPSQMRPPSAPLMNQSLINQSLINQSSNINECSAVCCCFLSHTNKMFKRCPSFQENWLNSNFPVVNNTN